MTFIFGCSYMNQWLRFIYAAFNELWLVYSEQSQSGCTFVCFDDYKSSRNSSTISNGNKAAGTFLAERSAAFRRKPRRWLWMGLLFLEMKADTAKALVLRQNKPQCVHEPSSPSTLPLRCASLAPLHLRKHREMSQPEKNENRREKRPL